MSATLPEYIPERSADECLRLWATVTFRARGRQHQQFADRIAHQAARPDWAPGPQQLAFMRELVDRYASDNIALDPDLLDRIEASGGAE